MATITLTWEKAASGGTPAKYKIYRRLGNFVEADVKTTPDGGFPITVNHVDSPAIQTFTDDGDNTNDATFVSATGTYTAPVSQSEYSYTVTALDSSSVESAEADNEANAKNVTA